MFKFIENFLKKRNIKKVKQLLNAETIDWDLVKSTPHWVVNEYPATEVKKQIKSRYGQDTITKLTVVWNYEYNYSFLVVETDRTYWEIDDSLVTGSKTIIGEVITNKESIVSVHSIDDGCIIDLLNITDTSKYIIKLITWGTNTFKYTSATITDLNLVHTLDECERYTFSDNKCVLIDSLSADTSPRNCVKQWVVYDIEPDKYMPGFSRVIFYYVDETISYYGTVVVPTHATIDWLTINQFKQTTEVMSDLNLNLLCRDTVQRAMSKLSKKDMFY